MGKSLVLFLPFVVGCGVTSIRLWHAPPTPSGDMLAVAAKPDVLYVTAKRESATSRHRLDLYLPKDKKDFPVVVLFHGGAWMVGDNRCCGLYPSVAEYLASQGIGVAIPNYRLSPTVKHPEHVKDAARAVAWVKAHIAEHGGNADKIFLAGHSAGGHLVALLATDEKYLKTEGLQTTDIRGVVALCGVYEIPPGDVEATLGGDSPKTLRMNAMLPLRGEAQKETNSTGVAIPIKINMFGPVFGNDPKVRADASPINHVRSGLPSFLIFSAEFDLPLLPEMATKFHEALKREKCDARLIRIEKRNHNSIMFQAIEVNDPVARAIVELVTGRGVEDK
ncbi:MAG: alpha/beta hydrolase [Planctomycetes bacterium]|nr:alpha/beta hydrolase [Planctomycetota bacterium]